MTIRAATPTLAASPCGTMHHRRTAIALEPATKNHHQTAAPYDDFHDDDQDHHHKGSGGNVNEARLQQRRRKQHRRRLFFRMFQQIVREDGVFLSTIIVLSVAVVVLVGTLAWKISALTSLVPDDDRAVVSSWHSFLPHVFQFSAREEQQRPPRRPREAYRPVSPVEEDMAIMAWNPIYRIPESFERTGDRGDAYVTLRQRYDQQLLPPDAARSLSFVQTLQQDMPTLQAFGAETGAILHSDQIATEEEEEQGSLADGMSYNIYNCPDEPPPGYPYQWNLVDQVLKNWPADEYDRIPSHIYNGLCIFDYQKDFDKALRYRRLEQPFVTYNDPQVARTVERWHQPGYVEQMVGPNVQHRTEHNTNNHFLYHQPPPRNIRRRAQNGPLRDLQGRIAESQNPEAEAELHRMTYREWLNRANVTDPALTGPHADHWYFRLIGCGYMGNDGSCDKGSTEALFDELPFFAPKRSDTVYMGDASEQKGIHCRFGMKGVIAENHFDGSRNSIALLMGQRRYILSHPNQCDKLTMLPKGHPSARHSAIDYTNPDLERFPEFSHAMANEVVLQPGQVLYLPTNWFHFIVSLELNMQCNTRSGITQDYPLGFCGF